MESQDNESVVCSILPPKRGGRLRKKSSKYCNTELYTTAVRKRKPRVGREMIRDQDMDNEGLGGNFEDNEVLSAADKDNPYSIDNDNGAVQK
jgi:hypothetical protein